MRTQTTAGHTRFILESPMDGRGKYLLILNAMIYLGLAGFLLWLFFFGPAPDGWASMVIISLVAVVTVIAYRYFAGSWKRDTLLVREKEVVLDERTGLTRKKRTFERKKITNLRVLEKPALTEHALAGKTIDYLGFQTEDKVINEIFGDHKVGFDYEGRTITFGRQLYSWDVEKIRQVIDGTMSQKAEEVLPWNEEEDWSGYWIEYDLFETLLKDDHQAFIAEDAENARMFADGTEAGWRDHRKQLLELRERYIDQLTLAEKGRLDKLLAELSNRLRI